MTSIYQIIMLIIGAVRMLIILHFIMSWLISFQILNLRQRLVAQIWLGLNQILEPIYNPIRRFLPRMGTLDLSPLIALVCLYAIEIILNNNIDFLKIYNTYVFGVVKLIQTCLPYMKKNGQVINISSIGGIQGSMKFAGLSAYSSSKGALITLTELLAEEYKDSGIHFNVLALGAVQTEMLEEAFPGYEAPTSAIQMAEYIFDFATKGSKLINGKIIQISSTTP